MKYLLALVLMLPTLSFAAIDSYQFNDPERQASYETLTSELRCLVCQNQTIADSNAELAADLRRQVYEMLQQGKSKDDILKFMTDRYGDFVLYKPPFKAKTGFLWLGPVIFLILGLIALYIFVRHKKMVVRNQDDTAQLAKIRSLLDEGE
jgi:cytochrome c-type biogenesis protein CcmH